MKTRWSSKSKLGDDRPGRVLELLFDGGTQWQHQYILVSRSSSVWQGQARAPLSVGPESA
jgi:hypothetical protein